ncbi:MAG: GNAT family N-acetyltransferase [Planctomycetes bacterium]|nr:GNAT family N-acetyltransferase [Planctomycetota bacterium]
MPEVLIRPYSKRDRKSILSITDRAFEGFCLDSSIEKKFGRLGGTNWQERKRASIEQDLRRNPEHAFVAESDGELIGYLCARLYRTTRIGHVANMALAPQWQNRGVGRMLLNQALDHFRRYGLKFARIETLADNERGRHLYDSAGFEEVGRQVFYFREL